MVDQVSPLGAAWRPGSHGNFANGVGVVLSETQPGSIVQLAAWPGQEKAVLATIRDLSGLSLADGAGGGAFTADRAAFGFAPGRFLVVDETEDLSARCSAAVTDALGTVTDLSHGRTAIRIAGPKAEWILSKFYAIDFALPAFPLGTGRSTTHHDIFTLIQRTGDAQFDLYVYRSFARALWTSLEHASHEVGYEVK